MKHRKGIGWEPLGELKDLAPLYSVFAKMDIINIGISMWDKNFPLFNNPFPLLSFWVGLGFFTVLNTQGSWWPLHRGGGWRGVGLEADSSKHLPNYFSPLQNSQLCLSVSFSFLESQEGLFFNFNNFCFRTRF